VQGAIASVVKRLEILVEAIAVMVHEAFGFDSAKQIDGRKRFTLVDTLGLPIAVHVVAANVPERTGAKQFWQRRIETFASS
jgi:Transposase DDE domain